MPDERPVASMTIEEVGAELRRVTGTPWANDADGPRRQALWRRLDQLTTDRLTESQAGNDTRANADTQTATEGEETVLSAPSPSPAAWPPDLQALVDRAGRRRAAELGEVYVEDLKLGGGLFQSLNVRIGTSRRIARGRPMLILPAIGDTDAIR
jgi:hypothetical protein